MQTINAKLADLIGELDVVLNAIHREAKAYGNPHLATGVLDWLDTLHSSTEYRQAVDPD